MAKNFITLLAVAMFSIFTFVSCGDDDNSDYYNYISSIKEAGDKFLAENAKREGVKVTPSGLQYEVLVEGTGAKPVSKDVVRCYYKGALIDGSVFDSCLSPKTPAEFSLDRVIGGWTEGLQLMQEGAKCRFYIPSSLGYGAYGVPGAIPPYSVLIFEVELVKVVR